MISKYKTAYLISPLNHKIPPSASAAVAICTYYIHCCRRLQAYISALSAKVSGISNFKDGLSYNILTKMSNIFTMYLKKMLSVDSNCDLFQSIIYVENPV